MLSLDLPLQERETHHHADWTRSIVESRKGRRRVNSSEATELMTSIAVNLTVEMSGARQPPTVKNSSFTNNHDLRCCYSLQKASTWPPHCQAIIKISGFRFVYKNSPQTSLDLCLYFFPEPTKDVFTAHGSSLPHICVSNWPRTGMKLYTNIGL